MNILIDMPVFAPVLDCLTRLEGANVSIIEEPATVARELPQHEIADCEVLFCTIPPTNHRLMPQLKMVQISSAGYTQLIGQKFEERQVSCCNALGVFDVPIAEWNISMMINLARNFPAMLRNQDEKLWDRSSQFQNEIRGNVVGIWGYGGIGRETARLAKALGMKVHVLTRTGVHDRNNIYSVPGTGDAQGKLPDRVFVMDEKAAFLKDLDFLIMAIPETNQTKGIVGKEDLRMLKPSCFLLNPARGPLVKEQALIEALKEGLIAGAALDTHYCYPLPKGHPLWEMKNVILTPHISGSSASPYFLERVWDIFYQNLVKLKKGQPLLNKLSLLALKGN